jgi:glycosyltransferase involved in cell wall biosynthesis
MRVLMLGTTNSPHVEDLVLELTRRGLEVVAAGDDAPSFPPSSLPGHGIRVERGPGGLAGTRAVRRVRWLRLLADDVGPDLVHAHYLVEDPFYAVVAGMRPLLATAWGSDVLITTRAQRLSGRLVARRADLLTADSAALLDAVVALGADRSRLRLFTWGIDLDRFSPGREEARRRLELPDAPIVLVPRGLRAVYNPTIAVAAFDRIVDEFPDALLLIKHYGDLPAELAHLLTRDDIRVVGHVPAEEMPDYYRAASVCVSIPSSDSSPRSVWEAMACGCPCVLSDLPWVHESIVDGREALVTPIEESAVADAIGRVLRDLALAASLAEHGRALVERDHSRKTQIDGLVAEYEALVARHASS